MKELTQQDYEKMAQLLPFLAGVMQSCQAEKLTPELTAEVVKQAADDYCTQRYGTSLIDEWKEALVKQANGLGGPPPSVGAPSSDPTNSLSQDLGAGSGMAPPGTDPNQLAKQQAGGGQMMEDPEDAALRAKPVPTNPFDFRNHPAILQMQKRQKDLLAAKKKELEQSQAHTSGLF